MRLIWAMTILISGVIWVFAFVTPAFALMGLLADAVRALLWRNENGRYYAFDGQRIRVVDVDGEPWVAEADVLKVLGAKALSHLNWQKMPADEYGEIAEPNLKGFSEKRHREAVCRANGWLFAAVSKVADRGGVLPVSPGPRARLAVAVGLAERS